MLNVQAVKQAGAPTSLKIPPISLQNIQKASSICRRRKCSNSMKVDQSWSRCSTTILSSNGRSRILELPIITNCASTRRTENRSSQRRPFPDRTSRTTAGRCRFLPTYYRPDSAFITEVEQHKFAAMADGRPQMIIDLHHLFWQVAGFHRYAKNGIMLRQMAQNVAVNKTSAQATPQPSNASPQPVGLRHRSRGFRRGNWAQPRLPPD